jgi:hypothetical protein
MFIIILFLEFLLLFYYYFYYYFYYFVLLTIFYMFAEFQLSKLSTDTHFSINALGFVTHTFSTPLSSV